MRMRLLSLLLALSFVLSLGTFTALAVEDSSETDTEAADMIDTTDTTNTTNTIETTDTAGDPADAADGEDLRADTAADDEPAEEAGGDETSAEPSGEAADAAELGETNGALASEETAFALLGLELPEPAALNLLENDIALSEDGAYVVTGGEPTDHTITVKAGVAADVLLEDVEIGGLEAGVSAVTLEPGAKLTLTISGDCALTGGVDGAGILVPAEAALELTGEAGALTAVGNNGDDQIGGGSGIGGTNGAGDTGAIWIHDLRSLTAEGYGSHCSGIGTGDGSNMGGIVIERTTIERAAGGWVQSGLESYYGKGDQEGGCAIGGGGKEHDAGVIALKDVIVKQALGGSKCAAIGSGCWSGCASIDIAACTLREVRGGGGSAGIGLGRNSIAHFDSETAITIADSTLRAEDGGYGVIGGGYGAAIGTAYNEHYYGDYSRERTLKLDRVTVTIENSTVRALGGRGAAAIGDGYKNTNTSVSILSGSDVTASAGEDQKTVGDLSSRARPMRGASAIGSGSDGSGVLVNSATDGASANAASVTISSDSSVLAFSNGDKWAIDRTMDASGTAADVLQLRLLDGEYGEIMGFGEQNDAYTRNPVSLADTASDYTLTITGESGVSRAVTVPGGMLCVAVTMPADRYTVEAADGTVLSYLKTESYDCSPTGGGLTVRGTERAYGETLAQYEDETGYGGSELTYLPYKDALSMTVGYRYAYPTARFAVAAENAAAGSQNHGGVTYFDAVAGRVYDITYVLNGTEDAPASNSEANPDRYLPGSGAAFAAPSRSGYTFLGWYADEALTEPMGAIGAGEIGDRILYAAWSRNSSGGGSHRPTEPEQPDDVVIGEPEVPTGDRPEEIIEEPQVPGAAAPELETVIGEAETPLGDAPDTGDTGLLTILAAVMALSLAGLAAIAIRGKKREK